MLGECNAVEQRYAWKYIDTLTHNYVYSNFAKHSAKLIDHGTQVASYVRATAFLNLVVKMTGAKKKPRTVYTKQIITIMFYLLVATMLVWGGYD